MITSSPESTSTIEATETRRPLAEYLALEYPFHVLADPEGGYVVVHPDLPGCMTQFDDLSDLPWMVKEARELWIESEYERGNDIPEPSYPETYSGKFVARLPRSLHRTLAEQAERDGVSLNQHVVALLGAGAATNDLAARVDVMSVVVERLVAKLETQSATDGGSALQLEAVEAPPARRTA